MSDLAIIYKHFTLDQWKLLADAVAKDESISREQRFEILSKFPSAAL